MKRIGIVFIVLFPFFVQANTDLNIAAREDFYRNRIVDMTVPQTVRFQAYDSLIYYLEIQDKVADAIAVNMDYASKHSSLGNYLPALHLYENVKNRLDSISDSDSSVKESRLRCLYEMGKITMNLGLYPQSVRYFFEVLDLGGSQNYNYAIRSYSNLVLLFMNMKQEKQAYYYVDMARRLVESKDSIDRGTLFVYYNNISGLYYMKQRYDSAIISLNRAKNFIGGEQDQAVWNYNIGNIYLGIGEAGLAREYLRQVLAGISDSSFFGYVHIVSVINLAYLYGLDKDYDQALRYYKKALEMAKKTGANKLEATVYIEMSAIYKAKKQYVQALELLEEGVSLRDSLFSSDRVESVNLLSQEYLQKERKMEMAMLERQLEYVSLSNRHKNTVLTILLIFLLIFGMSFFIALYNWYKQRKQVKEQALGSELREREQSKESEEKIKELAAVNLQLVQATEIIAECRTEIKKMRTYKAADTKESLQHLDEVLTSFNIDSAWDEFELYFRQIHRTFFTRLNEVCPELTRGELRTCALLVLNFSVKEIAGITHRSIRTVEAAVYQIRKKMNVPAEVRTLNFLHQFLDEA